MRISTRFSDTHLSDFIITRVLSQSLLELFQHLFDHLEVNQMGLYTPQIRTCLTVCSRIIYKRTPRKSSKTSMPFLLEKH